MGTVHRAVVVGALLTAVTTGVSPADALVTPAMAINVTTITGGFRVCGVGSAANPFVVGQWQLTASGSRSDGSVVTGNAGGPGQTFNQCFTVFKNGAVAGTFEVTFHFAGVGIDVAGHANRSVAWSSVTGDVII